MKKFIKLSMLVATITYASSVYAQQYPSNLPAIDLPNTAATPSDNLPAAAKASIPKPQDQQAQSLAPSTATQPTSTTGDSKEIGGAVGAYISGSKAPLSQQKDPVEERKKQIEQLSKVELPKPYIDDNSIILGTGSLTGVYYPAGGAICRMMNRERKKTGIRCGVESTSGSIYNISALRGAELDFAIVQSDWQEHAFDGTDAFKDDGPFEKLRFVFSLHNEAFTVIVKKNSNIDKFDDIQNKVVNVGYPGSGVRATMETVMKMKGWSNQTFKSVTELKPEDQADALCDNQIDVMIVTTGHPSGLVQDALSKCETKIISIDDANIVDYIQKHEEFSMTIIPGGLYVGVPNDVKTFGFKATLVTTTDTSTEVVYTLTKAVFENLDNFKKLHPVFYNLTAEMMIHEGRTAPMHPGAIKYFEEKGYVK